MIAKENWKSKDGKSTALIMSIREGVKKGYKTVNFIKEEKNADRRVATSLEMTEFKAQYTDKKD